MTPNRTRSYSFGDIIRVSPTVPGVPQPDDRRWLILTTATMERPWQTLFIGPWTAKINPIVPWRSLTGFDRVEEE